MTDILGTKLDYYSQGIIKVNHYVGESSKYYVLINDESIITKVWNREELKTYFFTFSYNCTELFPLHNFFIGIKSSNLYHAVNFMLNELIRKLNLPGGIAHLCINKIIVSSKRPSKLKPLMLIRNCYELDSYKDYLDYFSFDSILDSEGDIKLKEVLKFKY